MTAMLRTPASRSSWAPKSATSQTPLVRKLSALVRAHIARMRGSEHSHRAHGNCREKPQSFSKKEGWGFLRHKLESPAIADEAYSSRITFDSGHFAPAHVVPRAMPRCTKSVAEPRHLQVIIRVRTKKGAVLPPLPPSVRPLTGQIDRPLPPRSAACGAIFYKSYAYKRHC